MYARQIHDGGGQNNPELNFHNGPLMLMDPSTDAFTRIKKPGFIGSLFTLLAKAIVAASSRTVLRVYRFHTLSLDDVFLILAVLFMTASTAVVFVNRDHTYTQLNVSTARVMPPDDFAWQMVQFETLDNVATVTVWAAIFSVKFSFVMFFRKLIDRVKGMQILWWSVVAILSVTAPICMFFGFYICGNFTPNLLQICTVSGMVHREKIYLIVSVVLDILTDLLVISIPFALLWSVKLSLKRKLALLTVLGLSAFMIIIAIIRVTLSSVTSPGLANAPPGTPRMVPDTVWLFFWQQLEACIAVLMVSLTAFRSMLGQQSKRSQKGKYGSHTAGSGSKTEKAASFFGRFRRPKQEPFSDATNHAPQPFAAALGVERNPVDHNAMQHIKHTPVGFARLDDSAPAPPPKSPRFQEHTTQSQRPWVDNASSEDIELQGRVPARKDSFV